MKILNIFFVICLMCFQWSCHLFIDKYNGYTVQKISPDFTNQLFFASGNRIIGIDPNTYEVKTCLKVNSEVYYGGMTKDERIVFCMENKSKIYIVNSEGQIVSEINTYPIANYMIVAGKYLFVSQDTDLNNYGMEIYDMDSYKLVKNYSATNFHSYFGNYFIQIGDHLYVNLTCNIGYDENSTNKLKYLFPNSIYNFDLSDLSYTIESNCFIYPYMYNDLLFYSNIIYCVYHDYQTLSVYDRKNKIELTNIDLRKIINLPNTVISDPFCDRGASASLLTTYQPLRIGKDLLVFYDCGYYRSLAILDSDTYSLKTNIILPTTGQTISDPLINVQSRYRYIYNNKIFFSFHNSYHVTIYDHLSGKITNIVFSE